MNDIFKTLNNTIAFLQSGGKNRLKDSVGLALHNINTNLKNYTDPRAKLQEKVRERTVDAWPKSIFGGGHFGGAGAGGNWDWNPKIDGLLDNNNSDFHYPYMDYVRNTPITVQERGRSFSDAYATARKTGLSTFTFDGKLYNTDYNPNAKPAAERYESITVPMTLREVLNGSKEPIQDSTTMTPIPPELRGERWGTERRINGKLEHRY